MIRINLLTADHPRVAAAPRARVELAGAKLTAACALILVAGAGFVGWRYWTLSQESTTLDAQIAQAQAETAQLRSVLGEIQQFEQRRTQLQQRVGLIEQLRRDQTGPVHMLDEISRAMTPTVWLTELKQSSSAGEVLIDGRCTGLTGLTDFVSNLEKSGYFKRSVEILSTQVEGTQAPIDVIKFSLKAQFEPPAAAEPSKPPAKPAT